jgi:Flp pilus assembly protein protease CpaA
MIDLFLVRAAAIILASGAAAYTDYKTGLIYDYITYPLIGLGILINLFDANPVYSLGLGGIVFAMGLILYYLGKLGGGDVKLFTGLALALPFYGSSIFVVSALFFAAITAVVFFGLYYFLKYWRQGIDFKENSQGIKRASMLAAFVGVYFIFMHSLGWISQGFILVLIPLFIALLFLASEKGIRRQFFLKSVSLQELDQDELIAWEFLSEDLKKSLDLKVKRIIGEKEKAKLKSLGLNEVLIYRELPRFGPFIFVGVLLALLMPDFFLLLVT